MYCFLYGANMIFSGRETYKYLKSEIMKIAIKKFGESEFEKRQATRCMVKV